MPSLPAFLALLAAASTRGMLFLEPPGADQGLFMAEAELLQHGARFYADVWEHKPVGTPLLYAAAMQLWGRTYMSIQWLNATAALLSAVLLCALALRRGLSRAAASFAGLSYLAFHSGPAFGGFWAVAQAEVFLDPWLLGALLWLLPAAAEPASWRRCLAAGACVGVAITAIKTSALPLLFIGLLATQGARPVPRTLAFALGTLLVALLVAGYFATTGRARDFFDAAVRFNLAHRAVGAESFLAAPFSRVFPVPGTLALFYTFGLLGWATRRLRPSPDLDRWLTQSSLLWLLALAEVVFQRKFWGYQYHVTLLPLSALAAAGFERSRLLLRARFSARGALLCSSALALVLTLGYVQRCQRYFVQHPVLGAWLGSSTRADLERTYRWGRNVYDYESDQLVSAHIARITRPSDRIFVWSFEPILYFLAQRAPASRFLYDYPLHVPGSALNERYQEQLLSDLTAHPPAIFVVRRDDRNELEALDSMSQLAAMPGLAAYLAASYTPAWTLGDFVGYMRQSR